MKINPAALRAIRERSGYSQASLARAVDVSRSTVNLLEGGERNAGPELLKALADELGVGLGAITFECEGVA